jgi:phosphoribosyl-ATP pyrophosphohydrolase/phosphoribosyl-AMP cyclohydrolase/histidinol dehydrogenase
MSSVPYPSFFSQSPFHSSLASVGRCRIQPNDDSYRAIVEKNKQQAMVELDESIVSDLEKKKLQKKYMKEGVAMAADYLQSLHLDVSITDVEAIIATSDIIETDGCICACLLDAGCQTIVCDDLDALEASKVPVDRLMGTVVFDGNLERLSETIKTLKDHCSMITIAINQSIFVCKATISQILEKLNPKESHTVICFSSDHCKQEPVTELAAFICSALKEGAGAVCLQDTDAQVLGKAFSACLKTDRTDGLYTTVVCTRNGEALGLVYSSVESIVTALEKGRGVYYSRSRRGLWCKGDTSGHYQDLHRIDFDCDGDALRFTVTQRGGGASAAFCHLGTLTCWGHPHGLRQLEGVLQERLRSAPGGSYTKRLFEDPELLRDKLVEEAQELAEADSKQHVAEELADVLYFALVQASKNGVSLDDVVSELDKRARKVTRRQGDSKAFRIAAGKEILQRKATEE